MESVSRGEEDAASHDEDEEFETEGNGRKRNSLGDGNRAGKRRRTSEDVRILPPSTFWQ